MKHICFVAILFFVSAAAYSQKSAPGILNWSANAPLTWQSFAGKAFKSATGTGQGFMQLTADYDKGGLFSNVNYTVAAVFNTKDSWVPVGAQTPQLLKFYQVMFDVYEVYARRLRYEYAQTDFEMDASMQFNEKYIAMKDAAHIRVNQLVQDTQFGTDEQILNKWAVQIKAELEQLKEFKNGI